MTRHRQKILVGAFILLLLVVGGDRVVSYVQAPLTARRNTADRLAGEIEKRAARLARARQAAKNLAYWEQRSLPADPVAARSAYQAWLLDLVNRLELVNPNVSSGEPALRGGMYYTISFSLQAAGTLDQWTRFLFEFYRAGHLHQIRSIGFAPVGKKDQLVLSLAIEALALPGADRSDGLSEETSDRLAFAKLEDYGVIAARNLFGPGGSVDPTDHTYLTAINYVNGEPEAWFTLRTETDPDRSLLKLRVGKPLEIGQFRATVVDIAREDVILEADGQRWIVAVGESLAQAFALPPDF
jgi:hypothetical protein